MGKNDFFEQCKKELYDKNTYMKNYLNYMYSKTNEIFKYNNLPENIDAKKLEYFLQKNGFVFFTHNENQFNFFNGSFIDYDIYENPLNINCIMPDRTFKKFNIENDGILIKNDFLMLGLSPIYKKYGAMLNECEITLYINSIMNRLNYVIQANDDNTKKSAELFLEKIYNGEFSIIAGNAFLEGINIKGCPENIKSTKDSIELTQYIRASAFNEIGLNSNFNMKRERLNTTELTLNENAIKPFIENMYTTRLNAIEKINNKYGLKIEIELSSIWDNYDETYRENTDIDNNNTGDIKEPEKETTENNEGEK